MIEEFNTETDYVQTSVTGLRAMRVASAVQLSVYRTENGIYKAELGRMTVAPATLYGLSLGVLPDVPPGQRRATWLLTDAVNMALCDPEAHRLLHW
jgi:hypothetical protein